MRATLLALAFAVALAGCSVPPPAPNASPTPTLTPTPSPTGPTPASPPWDPNASSFMGAFDGERAYDLVVQQVMTPNGSVRTRVPGTPGNAEVARWIADQMSALDYSARFHHFNATYGCEEVAMHNVVAERLGTSGRSVVFAAHYDTRPIADKDADASARSQPIMGANDGGSGVAVLLELARVLPASNDTVRFLFFDGEDGGGYGGAGCTDWILGSRAYAAQMSAEETASISAFILVDMVGDKDLRIPREVHSETGPGRALLDDVFGVAQRQGHRQFVNVTGLQITDDHVPFLERGVPAIDLIHTTTDGRAFPSWHHTHDDDLDSVSADSLEAVGRALEAWFALRQD